MKCQLIARMMGLTLFLLSCSVVSLAQTAQITGRITDTTSAVIQGANIAVTHVDKGVKRDTTSNEEGYYTVPLLQPGNYRITIEMTGFKPVTRSGITLQVQQVARIDFTLELGEVSEKVEIKAAAPLVNTLSGAISTVVDAHRTVEMPLNGRNVLQLLTLTPGVAIVTESFQSNRASLTQGVSYSVNGGRATYANYFVDGASSMDFSIKGPAATPPPDAVEEFSVQSNSYSAEYGGGAGAIVNLITKSGTNLYHGGIFEFLRNDKLDARAATALTKPVLRFNQYGYTLGGPLTIPKVYRGKDRTFFFTAYQGTRIRQTPPQSTSVPSVLERQGDFSQSPFTLRDPNTNTPFPGNKIPADRFSRAALTFQEKFVPLPNKDGRLFVFNQSRPQDSDFFQARIDHDFGRNNLYGRYTNVDSSLLLPSTLPIELRARATRDQSAILSDTHTFSPNVINTFDLSVLRVLYTTLPSSIFSWADIGVKMPRAADTLPAADLRIGGYFSRVAGGTELLEPRTSLRLSNRTSVVRGRHQIKFGGEIQWQRLTGREAFITDGAILFQGRFSGDNYADLLLGRPSQVQQQSPKEDTIRRIAPSLFIQDDLRVTSKLAINVGLRYEPYLAYTEVSGHMAAFRPGMQSTIFPKAPPGMVFSGDPGIPTGIVPSQPKLFGPRFGFAYAPFANSKLSIRGGYGIFFDQPRALILKGAMAPFQPWALNVAFFDVPGFDDPWAGKQIPFPFAAGTGSSATFTLPLQIGNISPDFRIGYVQQWNLTVERELARNLMASASYVGSKGTALLVANTENVPIFVPGESTNQNIQSRRPFPDFGSVNSYTSQSGSSYHALQLSLNRRFADGLTVLANYTWSKSIDNFSLDNDGNGFVTPNPNNLRLNRGVSDFDIAHGVVSSFIYELPFWKEQRGLIGKLAGGWQLSGILTLQSGRPLTIVSGTTNSLSGISGDRADLVGDPYLSASRSREERIARWFNTAAFTANAPGTFGTVGRNTLRAPGFENLDFALARNIALKERLRLQVRGEFFNALNHVNLGPPNTSVSSALFGRIVGTGPARVVQAALKLNF